MGKGLKRVVTLLAAGVLGVSLLGCGGKTTAVSEWEKKAALTAVESREELYEAAKDEDVLKIYTVSSRLFDVAESFQKEYPELLVEVTYYRAEEILEQLRSNEAAGKNDCDLIFITNGDGTLTEKMIPERLAYKYVPSDIEDKMRKGGSDRYLSILLEVPLLTYNDACYEAAPIQNWWELTKPEWKGLVYITDPKKSMISYTMFAMFIQHSKEMEEAYKDCFGTDFVSKNGESAGEAFVRMLSENDLQVVNDSDDVANSIAAPGSESKAVGILNASKLRMREQGYPLQVCYDLKPFAGVINPANIMVAGNAQNINSAKLFIRWILGETDGTGEGYLPFLQEGAWPARDDVVSGATKQLSEMNVIYTDETYAAKIREDFLDSWGRE